MNSIKTKLTIVLLMMALFPLLILGFINYYQTTDVFTKSIQDFLLTIVKSKESALENYIESTETTGLAIAKTDVVQEYISFAKKDPYLKDSEQFKQVEKRVENLLYSFQEANWGKYHHIFLIDHTKKIAISPNHGIKVKGSPSSHLHEDTTANAWAVKSLEQGVTTVSDYSSWIESDHTHQMLFYPVKDISGKTLAVIGFELQIPHEQKILSNNFELGETGKVFLATTDGVPIVYKGIQNQTPLGTAGIDEANTNASGYSSGVRTNSEGVEVIDLYLKHNKYPWILVAEIETKEAFSSISNIQNTIILVSLITFVLALIIAIVLAKFIVNPIKNLTAQMEEVSLGKIDIKVDYVDRKDEIGSLAQAFTRIVKSLTLAMQNFDI